MPPQRRRPDRPASRFPSAPPVKKPTSYTPELARLLRDKPTDLAAFLSQAKVDADGNVFKETEIKSRRSTWAVSGTTTLTRPLDYEPTPGNCGVQSLSFYARKAINGRTQDFDRRVLHHIPWKFGRMIWQDAVKTGRDTFLLWSAFVTVYPTHLDELGRRRAYELHPHESVVGLIETIVKTGKFTGLVDLDLSEIHDLDDSTFLDLCRIPGLRSLKASNVSDLIVRAWARNRGKGMNQLKILSLHLSPSVTGHSFEYASWFPKLQTLEIVGCNINLTDHFVKARRHGWSLSTSGFQHPEDPQELAQPLLAISFSPDPSSFYRNLRGVTLEKFTFEKVLGPPENRSQGEEKRMETKKTNGKSTGTIKRRRVQEAGDFLCQFKATSPVMNKKRR